MKKVDAVPGGAVDDLEDITGAFVRSVRVNRLPDVADTHTPDLHLHTR